MPECTPKIHVMFYHIKDFIDRQSSFCQYSEQAAEAGHQGFHYQWQNLKRISKHPEYDRRLTSCVIDYNSKHH